MIQEFNKVTTTSNFIKNLLISTYLPLIRTVRDYDYIIKDRLYIYKCEVIKCTKSGYISVGVKNSGFKGGRASYIVLNEYHFGERNDKLCTNYISNSEGYDSLTHERLGKYLRNLRDMYSLNLMPLYNCFSNQILQAHHISNSGIEKTSVNYNTKIYKVPIRFNTDYTICMDNVGLTTFAPAFIKNNNLIYLNNTRFGNGVDATNKYIKLHRTGVVKNRPHLRFNDPFVIRFNNVPETKRVQYYEMYTSKIDYLHDDNLYEINQPTFNLRFKYYIKNSGTYDIVSQLTEEVFNANKTNYYYNDNGVITRCTNSSEYDNSITYYKLTNSLFGNTYLSTNLTPSSDVILYVGTDPSTGRTDSSYNTNKYYFKKDINNENIIETDIETEIEDSSLTMDDEVTVNLLENDQLLLSTNLIRLYDSPDFKTVSLVDKCSIYHPYSDDETYYVKNTNDMFEEWNYTLKETEFNSNKRFFYTQDVMGNFIRCKQSDTYSSETTYYVLYKEEYISPKEYHFDIDRTNFYITNGFIEEPHNYYKLVDGKFIRVQINESFDINTIYAITIEKHISPWREKDSNGNLVYSSDIYLIEGKEYYSSYNSEKKAYYTYDITEENCALYDYLEDNLYLLIQVPKTFESNIVILEGDYTNTQSEKISGISDVSTMPDALADYMYTSNLKLMQLPTTTLIPFSNTLIEFLLWNVICNLDTINNNMDRLALATRNILYELSGTMNTNYWHDQYRKYISDIGRNRNNIPVFDNLGYVTKNLEQVIFTTSNNESYLNEY